MRQAVQRLSALGIVRSRQGKGTYVEQVDTSFYLNLLIPSLMLSGGDSISILEFTKSIQVECVRIVSQCASDEEIARLSDYLEQMRFAGDYESYFHFDMGYHSYLAQLTGESAVYQSDRNCGKSASCLSAGYRCLSRQQKGACSSMRNALKHSGARGNGTGRYESWWSITTCCSSG